MVQTDYLTQVMTLLEQKLLNGEHTISKPSQNDNGNVKFLRINLTEDEYNELWEQCDEVSVQAVFEHIDTGEKLTFRSARQSWIREGFPIKKAGIEVKTYQALLLSNKNNVTHEFKFIGINAE